MTVYLKLLHGRDDPDEDMQDWGFHGPVLGPFVAVHVTYRDHIRCFSDSATEQEIELGFTDDMLTYEGKYYGDFEIAAAFGSDTPAVRSDAPAVKDGMPLHAAAPLLLDALELCVDCLAELSRLDDGTPSVSALINARTAIAKAKGD